MSNGVEAPAKARTGLVIAGASVGTLFEWYDFFLYGSLATFISKHFFSNTDPTTGYILALLAFFAGFLVRPLGAVIFGRLGDIWGRKNTFLVTMVLMGLATVGVSVLPGYDAWGLAAPVGLIALRLVQGLALGGEYGGAAIYVVEHAPANKRGLLSSWIQTTATLGLLLSLGVVLYTRLKLGEAVFADWGWRIPFGLSAVLLIVSLIIRLALSESPVFQRMVAEGKSSKRPLAEAFGSGANVWRIVIALIGLVAGQAVIWYTGQFYALFFLEKVIKVDGVLADELMAAALLIGTPFFVLSGWLSDKVGRKYVILVAVAVAVAQVTIGSVATPGFDGRAMDAKAFKAKNEAWGKALAAALKSAGYPAKADPKDMNLPLVVAILAAMVALAAIAYGPLAAMLTEMFPARIRYTSMSIPYHIGNGWFGGILPSAAFALTAATGDIFYGLWYPVVIAAATAVIGLLFLRETRGADIEG
ncbi:MAG TPA: MFS transporter [Caulobacteraceae bacterium]|jgi:MFS family permease